MHTTHRLVRRRLAPGWVLALLALILMSACGGGDGGSDGGDPTPASMPPVAGFSLAITPATLTVGQGQEGVVEVTVQRDAGFTEPVSVTLVSPPAGVTADPLVLLASQTRALLSVHLSADLAAGSVLKIDIAASAAGITHAASSSLSVSAPQAHAQERIAAALEAGTLDLGSALLYRAYALLGDKRLPDAYLGAGSAEEDSALFDEIRLRFANLPVATQDALRPFMVRPADPRSVWNARAAAASSTRAQALRMTRQALSAGTCAGVTAPGDWISKRSASHPVRVWAQCAGVADVDADSVVLIDKTLAVLDKVYTPMTTLMGEPLPDLEGDDNAIDLYILDDGRYIYRASENRQPHGLATTYGDYPETARGKGGSAFVTLRRSAMFTNRFHNTVIHEFFHVLQRAHNDEFMVKLVAGDPKAHELHWFVEASAAWASAYFDRTITGWVDGRGAYADVYKRFKNIFLPAHEALNTPGGSASQNSHDYSAFIWPYFVEKETGSAAFMKTIWNGLDTVSDFAAADAVIDSAYPFAPNFKRFALRNINTELLPGDPLPEATRHVSFDKDQFLDDKTEPPYVRASLAADQEYAGDALEVKHLSARYVRLTVPDGNTTIRKVTVDVRELLPADGLAVQALVLTENGWLAEPIDISPDKAVFCFDKGPSTASVRGSFREILLIVSNHALKPSSDIAGKLKVSPKSVPCAEVWEGTVTQAARNENSLNTVTFTSKVDLVLEFDDTAVTSPGEVPYRLKSGTFTWNMLYDNFSSNPACRTTVTGAGALPLTPYQPLVPSGGAANLSIFPETLQYGGSGLSVVTVTTVSNCNSSHVDETKVDPFYTLVWWNESSPGDVSADGRSIRRNYTASNGVSFDIRLDKKIGAE